MKKGWEIKKLDDITSKIGSGATPRGGQSSYKESGISLIRSMNVHDEGFKEKKLAFIDDDQADKLKNVTVEENDVLLNITGASVARCCIAPRKFLPARVNQHVSIIRLENDILESRFLHYALTSKQYKDLLLGIGEQGATRQAITKVQLQNFKISYPKCLKEQKQIVAILDKAFAAIDQAKANIEKNIENAKELFQSKLNQIFSQKGEGWDEKTLGEVAYVKSGGTPLRSKKEYWDNGYIPWYSSGELNDLYTIDSKRFITQLGLESSNTKLFPKGSLLIGMYDTAALKMSIIDRNATFNQAVAGVEPNQKLNLEFVLHAINAIKPELLNQRRGVRQKNLSLTKIKNIKLSFPNIDSQNKIVNILNEFSYTTNALIDQFRKKSNDFEELKKSILQKAFAGELT